MVYMKNDKLLNEVHKNQPVRNDGLFSSCNFLYIALSNYPDYEKTTLFVMCFCTCIRRMQ